MKRIIQFLSIIILLSIIFFIVIVIFNPSGSRDKLVSRILNSYLSSKIENYSSLPKDAPPFEEREFDHPLLNDVQEQMIYELGVDTSKLPTEISDDMKNCFIENLGQERANELVNGGSPTEIEVYKARDCLIK